MVNTEQGVVVIQDRRLCTDTLFIRAQSTIRADGFSSAQDCNPAATADAILIAPHNSLTNGVVAMHIDLRYGKGTYRLDLDAAWDVTVIRKPEMPLLADPVAAVRAALAAPVGARPLAEEARGAKSAC